MVRIQSHRFLFGLIGIILFPSIAFAAPEASVAINSLVSSFSVNEETQSLVTIDITNTSLEVFDIRRVVFENTGTLNLLSSLENPVLVSNGETLSNRYQIGASTIEFWLQDISLKHGETISMDIRAVVSNLEEGLTIIPSVKSISVKMDNLDLVRDIEIDLSSGRTSILAFESAGKYVPAERETSTFNEQPDLSIEQIRFLQKRGYMYNVFVIPVCNKGKASTNGERIEATVYAPNTLRDFSIRKTLEAGKCFEYILSAKRDLEVNTAGDHSIRVELDQQNIIKEERENNNSRLDVVVIDTDTNFSTNNRTLEAITDETRQVIRSDVRPRRPRVARRTTSRSSSVRGTSKRGTSDALERYKALLKAKKDSNRKINSTGIQRAKTQTSQLKKSFSAAQENNIIREELPTVQTENTWEARAWERSPLLKWKRPTKTKVIAAPNQLTKDEKRPTFTEPNEAHRKRTSYRSLRAGFRGNPNFTGQRSNNDPELESKNDFTVYCKDSDGLNFFEKGTVEYKTLRMVVGRTASDEVRGPYVLEYYCEGDYMRRKLFECDEDTGDGICQSKAE